MLPVETMAAIKLISTSDKDTSDFPMWRHAFFFENGFGISVIRGPGSYGNEDGLFEIGVIRETENGGFKLDYDTSITDDVVGWLTPEEVLDYAIRINDLKEDGDDDD